MGPFRFLISREAQRINFEALDKQKQEILTKDFSYHPDQHSIFLFFVAPEFIEAKMGSKRQRRRNSYSRVDRIFIETFIPSNEIKLLGMYPISRTDSKTHVPEFNIFVPLVGKIKAHGKVKDAVKKGDHVIIANRTDSMAQWIFLRPYIEQRTDFEMNILCSLPNGLDDQLRYISCSAVAKEKGREIVGLYRKKIMLPQT